MSISDTRYFFVCGEERIFTLCTATRTAWGGADNQAKRGCKLACERVSADCSASVALRRNKARSAAELAAERCGVRFKETEYIRQKIRQVSTCRIFLSIAKAMVYHHDAVVYLIRLAEYISTRRVYHQPQAVSSFAMMIYKAFALVIYKTSF